VGFFITLPKQRQAVSRLIVFPGSAFGFGDMPHMANIVAIGECMVELSLLGDGAAGLGYAGDVFNTAVYLSRFGDHVDFVSAVGSGDPFSQDILNRLEQEGVSASLVAEVRGKLPGLYAIARAADGERQFFYWREQSPFRQMFDRGDFDRIRSALVASDLIFLSGITQAVIGEAGRRNLHGLLADAKSMGVQIAFDPNYRPRLWPSPKSAREALEEIAPYCSLISVSQPDLDAIYGTEATKALGDWANCGVEVVNRHEDRTVEIFVDGQVYHLPAPEGVRATDTTGAGDSFNAGYISARLSGQGFDASVAAGRRISAAVVQHLGAIISVADMPRP